MRYKFIWIFLILLSALLVSCGLTPGTRDAGQNAQQIYTQAAETVLARLTAQPTSAATETSAGNPPAATATLPPAPATPTPTLEPTPTLLPSPTATLAPTPTATPVPIPCDRARFVADVTIPDGSVFLPGADFVKTWRIRNAGSCTWTTGYDIVFQYGDRMSAPRAIPLPGRVAPNETVDISVELTAPDEPGSYRGYWAMRNQQGVMFAAGKDGDVPFWVDIEVIKIDPGKAFSFAANYCLASWRTENGLISCPSASGSDSGFVQVLSEPDLENRHENEPAIWVHPNRSNDGYISGIFPAIPITPGDRFVAWVGCLADSPRCDVTFELSYQIGNGPVRSFGQWREVNDGKVTIVDIPLFEFAGQQVKFILTTYVNDNPAQADGFWFVPRIEHAPAAPPPP